MKDIMKSEEQLLSEGIGSFINKLVVDLSYKDLEFSEAINKWKPLLMKTVLRLHYITKEPYEDIFQDILTSLSRIYIMRGMELYRYEGRIYEIVEKVGEDCKIKTPFCSQIAHKEFFVDFEKLELVKQAKLSSLFFKKIQQHAATVLKLFFSGKNGFVKIGECVEYSRMRNRDVDDDKYAFVTKNIVEKSVYEVSLQDCSPTFDSEDSDMLYEDRVGTDVYNPEDLTSNSIFVDSMIYSGDPILHKVLSFGYANPHVSDHYIKSNLHISARKLAFSRRNLGQAFDEFLGEGTKFSGPVRPVHLPASIIK